MCNVHDVAKHVYGASRYHSNHWAVGQPRTVIILLNEDRLPDWMDYRKCRSTRDAAAKIEYDVFFARFNVIAFEGDIDHRDGVNDWVEVVPCMPGACQCFNAPDDPYADLHANARDASAY